MDVDVAVAVAMVVVVVGSKQIPDRPPVSHDPPIVETLSSLVHRRRGRAARRAYRTGWLREGWARCSAALTCRYCAPNLGPQTAPGSVVAQETAGPEKYVRRYSTTAHEGGP